MYVVIDERAIVVRGYAARFSNRGLAAFGFEPEDFDEWVRTAADDDVAAVEAFLVGQTGGVEARHRQIRARSGAPLIAMADGEDIESRLALFEAGADDVVVTPVHVREVVARVAAMRRRAQEGGRVRSASTEEIEVFFDGRDPVVGGRPLQLPRRERRILEFIVHSRGRRVTRTQIFNAVYGVFNDEIDETVIESHVSKLRKKLRARLGHDPIDSKRYLGYAIGMAGEGMEAAPEQAAV